MNLKVFSLNLSNIKYLVLLGCSVGTTKNMASGNLKRNIEKNGSYDKKHYLINHLLAIFSFNGNNYNLKNCTMFIEKCD